MDYITSKGTRRIVEIQFAKDATEEDKQLIYNSIFDQSENRTSFGNGLFFINTIYTHESLEDLKNHLIKPIEKHIEEFRAAHNMRLGYEKEG